MSKRRELTMTMQEWLKRAKSRQIKQTIANDPAQGDFQAILRVVKRRKKLDWEEAIALSTMVYGWMPTMMRQTVVHEPAQRDRLVSLLRKAKSRNYLTQEEVEDVKHFTNRSIVGASKLLHILNPEAYAIWDSRVANVFLWQGVAPGTYRNTARYIHYIDTIRNWTKHEQVKRICRHLRKLNEEMNEASDLRMIELVMFCRP